MTSHHLAQANVARRVAPLDDPRMKGFVDQLDAINAVAEASPGFVWRFQTESGNATEAVVLGDEELVFNLSVWESVEHLREYAYRSEHAGVLRDRGLWFLPPDRAPLVLWWVAAGTLPSIADAEARFRHLWEHGPTAQAFTFREVFPAPAS